MACPRCGVEQIDLDGLGFLYCEACKLCLHPSLMDGWCQICGHHEEDE